MWVNRIYPTLSNRILKSTNGGTFWSQNSGFILYQDTYKTLHKIVKKSADKISNLRKWIYYNVQLLQVAHYSFFYLLTLSKMYLRGHVRKIVRKDAYSVKSLVSKLCNGVCIPSWTLLMQIRFAYYGTQRCKNEHFFLHLYLRENTTFFQ